VPVSAGSVSSLIGPKGSVINKIRSSFDVQVHLPDASSCQDKRAQVEAVVAGGAENVEKAVQVINEIIEFGISPLTHPGFVKVEIDVDNFQKPFLIGKKGVEIKKIKEKYSVKVDVPSDKNVAIIMGQKHKVAEAQAHIAQLFKTIEDKVKAKRDQSQKVADSEAGSAEKQEGNEGGKKAELEDASTT